MYNIKICITLKKKLFNIKENICITLKWEVSQFKESFYNIKGKNNLYNIKDKCNIKEIICITLKKNLLKRKLV